jgi:hypothetical protein
MPKDDAANVQTAIRIPSEWVPRLQEIAGRLSRPGIPVTVSDAMRAAIAEGLGVLETQLQIQRTPVTSETRELAERGIRDEQTPRRLRGSRQ